MLIPSSVAECFEFASEALDLAEEFQTPIFVLSDLDLGMNNWMSDPFEYPTKPIKRGKVLTAEKLTELQGKWGATTTSTATASRGARCPAPIIRSRRTSRAARATTRRRATPSSPQDYKDTVDRLAKKFETAKLFVPKPVVDHARRREDRLHRLRHDHLGARGVARSAAPRARRRDQLLPPARAAVHRRAEEFVAAHDRVYVVEQNRDGQMADMIRLELGEDQRKLRKILHYTGLPCDARTITDAVLQMESTVDGRRRRCCSCARKRASPPPPRRSSRRGRSAAARTVRAED